MTHPGHERLRLPAAILILASSAVYGATSIQRTDASDPQVSHTQLHHYAIVGAVDAPATYSSDQPSVLLRELVARAGGLTAAASGGIRIFHQGRQRDQIFNPSGQPVTVPLQIPSGAIIVVERSQGAVGAAEENNFTFVACENLLTRPVVLGGDSRVTLTQLLRTLGQSQIEPQSIQVLPRTVQLGRDTSIPSGTVLVFDAAAIDQSALQRVFSQYPLQDVLPLSDPAPAPEPQPRAPRISPRVPLEVPRNADTENVATDVPTLPESGTQLNPVVAPQPPEVVDSVPDTEAVRQTSNLPGLQQVVGNEAVTLLDEDRESDGIASPVPPEQLTAPVSMPEPMIEADSVRPRPSGTQASEAGFKETISGASRKPGRTAAAPVGAFVPETDHVPTSMPAQSRFSLQIALAAAAAGGLALLAMLGAVLWSRRERKRIREHRRQLSGRLNDAVEKASSERHPLDLLINDELPVVDEEVVFPEGTQFHGRAVGFRYLVHNDAHSLRGPHFGSATQSHSAMNPPGVRRKRRAAGGNSDSPPTQPVQTIRPEGPAKPGSGTVASPLERALRTQQRESSS